MSKRKPQIVKALEGRFENYTRTAEGFIAFDTGDPDVPRIYYRPISIGFLFGFERVHEFSAVVEYPEEFAYKASRVSCQLKPSMGLKKKIEIECSDEEFKGLVAERLSPSVAKVKPEVLLVEGPAEGKKGVVVLARKYLGMGFTYSRDVRSLYDLVLEAARLVRRWIESS